MKTIKYKGQVYKRVDEFSLTIRQVKMAKQLYVEIQHVETSIKKMLETAETLEQETFDGQVVIFLEGALDYLKTAKRLSDRFVKAKVI